MTIFWPAITCKTFLLNKYIKLLLDISVFGKPKSILEIHVLRVNTRIFLVNIKKDFLDIFYEIC